jgi:hypothetical protein
MVRTPPFDPSYVAMTTHQSGDDWLNDVRNALQAGELVEPPDWVRERARRLFRSHDPSHLALLLTRIRASLVLDSRRRGPALAGVRSLGGLGGPWQLLYRGEDVDVDLLVRPNRDGHTLNVRGQALPLGGGSLGFGVVEALPADAPRRLQGRAAPSARSELQPGGEFALSNLERGRYDVLLRFGTREIELSGVEL